jgi:hypothetical protein
MVWAGVGASPHNASLEKGCKTPEIASSLASRQIFAARSVFLPVLCIGLAYFLLYWFCLLLVGLGISLV